MNLPAEFTKEFASFPAALRKLVEAELAVGNTIVALEHGFPAAPCGASIKLAQVVKAARRKSIGGINFYARNNSDYAGEFTTAERHFFVLEPPLPPEPEPDMNAIREAIAARQHAADVEHFPEMFNQPSVAALAEHKAQTFAASTVPPVLPKTVAQSKLIEQFRESMVMNYERWHDGIGYDIGLFKTAKPDELIELENLLVSRPIADWRDVEALAALNSPRALAALREALKHPSHEITTAISRHAPQLVSDAERTTLLIAALESADVYGGLTQALDQVKEFHPPEIIETLLRCALDRKSGVTAHFAALLLFLHGKAKSPFDWDQRPFFLRFNTPDPAQRETAFRELCEKIGVSPEKYLSSAKHRAALRKNFKPA